MKIARRIIDSLFGFVITKNHNWEYAGFWAPCPYLIAELRNMLHGIAPWAWRKRHPVYVGRHRRHYRKAWDSMPLSWELAERVFDNARPLESLTLPGELITY
jgi:hypothetical protein